MQTIPEMPSVRIEGDRCYQTKWQPSPIPGGPPMRVDHRVYRKPNGDLIPIPLGAGADFGKTVSTDETNAMGDHVDLYLAKPGWRNPTLDDLRDSVRRAEAGRKRQAEIDRMRDPVAQQERLADLNAKATAMAMDAVLKKQAESARGR